MPRGSLKLSELKSEIDDAFVAREVISFVMGWDYTEFVTAEQIDKKRASRVRKLVKRIKTGETLAYVLGQAWFYDLAFFVNENVLVPRADTEVLIEAVRAHATKDSKQVLDLCTGSGCVAVTLAKFGFSVVASDISEEALKVARRNAGRHSAEVRFVKSNVFQRIKGRFDVIVSNPPYIPTHDIGQEDPAILQEPRLALDGGVDGLEYYRVIAREGREFLLKGGFVAVEIGYDQGEKVSQLFRDNAWFDVKVIKDIAGRGRVVVAWRDEKRID